MKIYISYDSSLPYPQPALFGRGKQIIGEGNVKQHIPEAGFSSFEFELDDLAHGTDEELYAVTAPDTLEALPQAEIDAIMLERNKPVLRSHARDKMRNLSGSLAPDFGDGDDVTQSAYVLSLATARLNRRAKGQGRPNEDTLLDSLESMQDAFEAILADIDAGVITTTDQIDNDPRWGG